MPGFMMCVPDQAVGDSVNQLRSVTLRSASRRSEPEIVPGKTALRDASPDAKLSTESKSDGTLHLA